MKKYTILGAFAALVLAAAPSMALDSYEYTIPKDTSGKAGMVDHYGVQKSSATPARLQTPNQEGDKTVVKLWSAGKGVLYEIEVATATLSWVICIDSDTATGDLSSGPSNVNLNLVGIAYSRTTGTGGILPDGKATPREFRKGLACAAETNTPYYPLFKEYP